MKSGGGTPNSSSNRIHIYIGKLSQVTYDAYSDTGLVTRSDLIWNAVYQRSKTTVLLLLVGV